MADGFVVGLYVGDSDGCGLGCIVGSGVSQLSYSSLKWSKFDPIVPVWMQQSKSDSIITLPTPWTKFDAKSNIPIDIPVVRDNNVNTVESAPFRSKNNSFPWSIDAGLFESTSNLVADTLTRVETPLFGFKIDKT